MPYSFPKWWPSPSTSPSASATITQLGTTTAVMLDTTARQGLFNQTFPSLQDRAIKFSITEITHLILWVSIPVVLWLAYRQANFLHNEEDEGEKEEEEEEMTEEDWQQPWKTKDWMALYGLTAMACENEWQHTPFRDKYYQSFCKRWHEPDKNGLKRLLGKGIIPLFAQEGDVATQQLKWWGWSDKFPYVNLPLFRQSKKRAYFQFLVPHPGQRDKNAFLERIIDNKQGHGVTFRFSDPPPNGSIQYSVKNPPSPEGKNKHFSVGAESALELLLPFKKDEIFEKSHGVRAHQLRWFMKQFDTRRIPLLHHTPSALVCVEATDYRPFELDEWVWSIAQEAIPGTLWPAEATREAAERELDRCGFYVEEV